MKTSRFNAAVNGLVEKAKSAIRRAQVENALKSNELEVNSKLLALDDRKNAIIKEIALGESSQLKSNLQKLADLLQEEEALKASKELSSKLLAVLDEEVEVEDKKK